MRWLQTTIGEICLPTVQIDPTRKGTESFRYIDIAGIDREQKTIFRADPSPCESAPSRARKLVQAGDVLVSTVRPNLNAVALVPEELDGEIASTGFSVLRANQKLVNPHYLFYRVQHQEFVACLVANATGASYPAVTDGVVRRVFLPLPSLKEQARIVEILDEADRLRRLRRVADSKATRILPALFLKMFGDPETNLKNFPVVKLGTMIEDGPQNGLYKPSSAYGKGVRILRIDGFYSGQITDISVLKRLEIRPNEIAKYGLHENDIVINRVNSEEYLGKSAIIPKLDESVVFESNMMRLSVDLTQIDPLFLIAHLQTPFTKKEILQKAKRAINQASINQQDIRALSILKPPIELQIRFASIVQGANATLSVMAATIGKLDHLFDLLLHQAFSGQLTAKWREAHSKELLAEMEQQARLLNLPLPKELELAP